MLCKMLLSGKKTRRQKCGRGSLRNARISVNRNPRGHAGERAGIELIGLHDLFYTAKRDYDLFEGVMGRCELGDSLERTRSDGRNWCA
jgi:hypothetical protein